MARKRSGSLQWRPKGWHAQLTIDLPEGRTTRRLVDLETRDKGRAGRMVAKLVAELAAGRLVLDDVGTARTVETCEDLATLFCDQRQALGVVMARDERANFREHITPILGPLEPALVERSHVRSVLDATAAKGLSKGTVDHVRRLLVRWFGWMIDSGTLEANPASRVKLPPMKDDVRARVILTDDELAQFMASPHVSLELKMLAFVARTEGGMRTGELVRWGWESIDVAAFESCTVHRGKGGAPQQLEVPEILRPFLRAWWEGHGRPSSGPVFPSTKGETKGAQRATRGTSFARRLREGLLRAGIRRHVCTRAPMRAELLERDGRWHARINLDAPKGSKVRKWIDLGTDDRATAEARLVAVLEEAGAPSRGEACCPAMALDPLFSDTSTTHPVDFHSFRRAFNTALAEADIPTARAMHLAGHSDARTHQRYVMRTARMMAIPASAMPSLNRATPVESQPAVAKRPRALARRARKQRATVDSNHWPTAPEANAEGTAHRETQREVPPRCTPVTPSDPSGFAASQDVSQSQLRNAGQPKALIESLPTSPNHRAELLVDLGRALSAAIAVGDVEAIRITHEALGRLFGSPADAVAACVIVDLADARRARRGRP